MTNRAKALFSIVVIVRSTLLVALYRSFSPVEPFMIGFRHSSKTNPCAHCARRCLSWDRPKDYASPARDEHFAGPARFSTARSSCRKFCAMKETNVEIGQRQ